MMFLWALCGVPFGVYAIVQNFNIPIQIQPQCFCVLCLTCWAQCLLYQQYVFLPLRPAPATALEADLIAWLRRGSWGSRDEDMGAIIEADMILLVNGACGQQPSSPSLFSRFLVEWRPYWYL